MIIDKIRSDLVDARKTDNKLVIEALRLFIGELDRITKTPDDATVIKVGKKIIKNALELHKLQQPNSIGTPFIVGVIGVYLPKEEDIDVDAIISKIIADNPGQYDSLKARPENIGWFVGQVMKATQGKANPTIVKDKILDRL